jgi:hypothetical protein
MSQILCLDFGTSSLRAAFLDHKGVHSVLPIGRSVKSKLDDASIRSDILLSADGNEIYLSEDAIKARSSIKYLLYDASPKLWFKNPDFFSEQIFQESRLTREMLITALVAYALSACIDAAEISSAEVNEVEIRMSHPIWEESVANRINILYENVLRTAISLASEVKKGVISTKTFLSMYQNATSSNCTEKSKRIKVLEPIAAALTLFPDEDNIPRICTVIDIGAGTTDIGIFKVLYPDGSMSDKKKTLIPIGKPISLFTAGNTIDSILLDYIISKASTEIKPIQIIEVERGIRQIKELLFSDGLVEALNIDIRLKDFIASPKLKKIYDEIRTVIQSTLDDPTNLSILEPFFRNRSIKELNIVMSGGGGELSFITSSLKAEKFILGSYILPVNIFTNTHPKKYNASIERLAVTLGGSNYEYENLVTEYKKPIYYMRGSM